MYHMHSPDNCPQLEMLNACCTYVYSLSDNSHKCHAYLTAYQCVTGVGDNRWHTCVS